LVGGIWDEYAACRASAKFGKDHTSLYDQCLSTSLRDARARSIEAIKSYRLHAQVDRMLDEAAGPLCAPFRFYAYLAGHLDARDLDLDVAPLSQELVVGSGYEPFLNRLRDALRDLWSRRGHWTSLAEFNSVRDIARDLLADGGMILQRLPDGRLYVDVPLTPETTPSV
jgi:hypothetical protein